MTQQFILTVKRPGEEPRVKPYAYPKAAYDGFDVAVQRKGRLAESIILDEILDDTADGMPTRKTVREWKRDDQPEGPTVLWLVGDQNDEAYSYVAETLCPTIQDIKLVSFPLCWDYVVQPTEDSEGERVYYTDEERAHKLIRESKMLESTHANHLIWFPDYGSGMALHFLAAYHARYGRFPYIVSENGIPVSLRVIDLNKVYAK